MFVLVSFCQYPVSVLDHVFHRHTRSHLPVAVAGDGMYIVDREGRRYLDGSGGAAVSALGHSDPDVRRAIKEQVDSLAFAHTGFFTTEAVEELADHLIAAAPPGMDRVYFLSGGSEGIETALKMARQYFIEIGEPQRTRFISRRQSYHGNTSARSRWAVTWRAANRLRHCCLTPSTSPRATPIASNRGRKRASLWAARGGRAGAGVARCWARLGDRFCG